MDDHRAKLKRAREHLDALKESIDTFVKSNAYEVRAEYDAKSDWHIARFHLKKAIPPEWGLVVGDVIHNARSALDNLVYALGVRHSGKPADETKIVYSQFIICDTPANFIGEQRWLVRLSADARTAMERLQPYHRPDPDDRHPLSFVRDLSNVDKHRRVHFVFASLGSFSVNIEGPGLSARSEMIGYRGPLENGAVVRRWRLKGIPNGSKMNVQTNLSLEVAFSDEWPALGRSVVGLLDDVCSHIETVVFPSLEPFL